MNWDELTETVDAWIQREAELRGLKSKWVKTGRHKTFEYASIRQALCMWLRNTCVQNKSLRPTAFLMDVDNFTGLHPWGRLSYPRIGKLLKVNHATVILSIRRAAENNYAGCELKCLKDFAYTDTEKPPLKN